MFKFSAVSQIWKKYIQKLNDWDLPLTIFQSYMWRHIDVQAEWRRTKYMETINL